MRNLGVFYYFLSATRMLPRMIQCRFTSTTLNPRKLQRAGTHALSSPWSSQTYTTLRYTPSAVCWDTDRGFVDTWLTYHDVDAHHRFIAEESDWGFTRFSELRKLFHVAEGHNRPTIEEESADVTVFVRVLEDPTGVLWHNFVKYVANHFLRS